MKFAEYQDALAKYDVFTEQPKVEETQELKDFKVSKHYVEIPQDISAKYGGNDRFLERFLKARDFNHEVAGNLIKDALIFRELHHLDENISKEKENDFIEKFTEFWPVNFWGFSNLGNLVVLARLKTLRTSEVLKQFTEAEILDYFLDFNEKSILYQSFGNARLRDPNDVSWKGTVEVYDLRGVRFSQVVNFKAMRILGDILGKCQNVYPETLEKTFIINVPGFFKMFWTVVSKFLHKNTLQKVEVLSKSETSRAQQVLATYLDEASISELLDQPLHEQPPSSTSADRKVEAPN